MKSFRIDASLVCFIFVIVAAVPVASLRSKTYAVGYDLGRLKEHERELRHRNIELQTELAAVQRTVRDKYLSKPDKNTSLSLPEAQAVIHSQKKIPENSAAKGKK